ncbi:uncharacterized protein [Anoplolepis gracilipes]|uniref:uncharacterized protein isoform X2 n=1 Tax=Anoplolepis gracilipes TaxID=354296 RepID=UPI003B9FBA15
MEKNSKKRKYASSEEDEKKITSENNVLAQENMEKGHWWIKHCTIKNDEAHCRYCNDTRDRVSIDATDFETHLTTEHSKFNIKGKSQDKIMQYFKCKDDEIKCMTCKFPIKVKLKSSFPNHLEKIHKSEIENKQDDGQNQEINSDVEPNIKNIISNFTKYVFQKVEASKKQIIEEKIKEAQEKMKKSPWWINHCTIKDDMTKCNYCNKGEYKVLFHLHRYITHLKQHSIIHIQENKSIMLQYFKLQNDILVKCVTCNEFVSIRFNTNFSKHLNNIHKITSKQDEINQDINSEAETHRINLISNLIKSMFRNLKIDEKIKRAEKKVIKSHWWIKHYTIENDMVTCKYCKDKGKKKRVFFNVGNCRKHFELKHSAIYRQENVSNSILQYFKLQDDILLKCLKCHKHIQIQIDQDFSRHLKQTHKSEIESKQGEINQGISSEAEADRISLISSYKNLIKCMFQKKKTETKKHKINRKTKFIRKIWWMKHCTIKSDKKKVRAQCKQKNCKKEFKIYFNMSNCYTHLREHLKINNEKIALNIIIWKYYELVDDVKLKCTECNLYSFVQLSCQFQHHLIKKHQITKTGQDYDDDAEIESSIFKLIKNIYDNMKSNTTESEEDEQDDEPIQAKIMFDNKFQNRY